MNLFGCMLMTSNKYNINVNLEMEWEIQYITSKLTKEKKCNSFDQNL